MCILFYFLFSRIEGCCGFGWGVLNLTVDYPLVCLTPVLRRTFLWFWLFSPGLSPLSFSLVPPFIFFFQESLIREQGQQHDEMYYLWALSFFMAFNRGNGCRPELVSETLSIRTFHFIEKNITNYYEMMLTDRKEATSWSRRWEWALCCCSITFYHINKWGEFSL